MWNIGSGFHMMSSPLMPRRRFIPSALRTTASWERRQPLGCDVVPEVYIMMQGAPSATWARRAVSCCSDTSAARARNSSPHSSPEPGARSSATIVRSSGVAAAGAPGSARRQARQRCTQQRRKIPVRLEARGGEQQPQVRVADHVAQFVDAVARIQQYGDRPAQRAREQRLDHFGQVERQDADVIAGFHARRDEGTRAQAGPLGQLAVGQPRVRKNQRLALGPARGGPQQQVAERRGLDQGRWQHAAGPR